MLTDANGEERKGIEVYDAISQMSRLVTVWDSRNAVALQYWPEHFPAGTAAWLQTVRDLMLAGF